MNLFNTWPERQARLGHWVLLQLPRLCRLQQVVAGEAITLEPDGVALLLEGCCRQATGQELQAGQSGGAALAFIGLIDYLLGHGTSPESALSNLRAGPGGCRWLAFQRRHFRELIDIAPVLETLIIRQLALANQPADLAGSL